MKLAVIGRVIETAEITGADRIQQARVDCADAGKWSGVVGKEIEVGQLVTVFLQDAVLPQDPRWSFMERHKWRVRMARFKGVPSECVIVLGAPDSPAGTDMTEALGVTKYSKPIPAGMGGDAVGAFPSFIPKTDEPNFQAAQDQIDALRGRPWEARLKCDGSSCTVWRDEAGLHVASRNWELREFTATGTKNIYWSAARLYNWDALPEGVALQFEVAGPGIQGNPMGLDGLAGVAFTAYDYRRHARMSNFDLEIVAHDVGIQCAPVVASELNFNMDADALRRLAAGIRYRNGKPAEGIVIRSMDQQISFKVISLLYKD